MFEILDVVETQYGTGTIVDIYHNGDCEIEISDENGKTLCMFNAKQKDLKLLWKNNNSMELGKEGI